MTTPHVAIIGAGISGLCMAMALRRAGIDSFTIYEQAASLGGTWRDNTYPGSGCDVPSHLYRFSFERKADWSRAFAEQAEILAYLEQCAKKYALGDHIRFETTVTGARFDESTGTWHLSTSRGDETAGVVVAACGQLNRPHTPHFSGQDGYRGVSFHSARWRHDVDLRGRRVAVIGSGASAIQLIPKVAEVAGHVSVFQRSANWMIPKPDEPYTEAQQRRFERWPLWADGYRALIYWLLEARFLALSNEGLARRFATRLATNHLESQVTDPDLRRRLRPDYPIGCKRILISNDYYPALQRDNVTLVTDRIQGFSADGVVTEAGEERVADVTIFATGFETTSFLSELQISGSAGRSLSESWNDGARAYLGMTVPGFPNLFMLYGPNTNLGHNSIIFMIECQVRYVLACIRSLASGASRAVDVKEEVLERFDRETQERARSAVWAEGCTSWYKTASGRITNNWPAFTVEYWWRTRRPNSADFVANTTAGNLGTVRSRSGVQRPST